MSKIQWTERTWNPIVGCSKVSPGCKACYAEVMAKRLKAMGRPEYQDATNGNGHWTGMVNLVPDKLEIPLARKKPTVYFVNSMSDLFHESLDYRDIAQAFDVMLRADWHTYQVLTKRPERMPEFFRDYLHGQEAPHHIWLGTSTENQKMADERISHLLMTPVTVRFLSCEPLLEQVDLWPWLSNPSLAAYYDREIPLLDWVIVGGESGPNARPMRGAWVRQIIEQCKSAGVPVFVKQMGSVWAKQNHRLTGRDTKGGDPTLWPEDLRIREYPGGGEAGR